MPEFLRLKKSNCKNCYKCIRNCPVKSIRFSGNQAHIVSDECILCGQCFVVCPQNAKEIVNDVEKVKVMLMRDEEVYVSLAPSFIANYNGIGINGMRKALQQLGFKDVEETAVGATIVKKEYERILQEDHPQVLISSCCHSVNLLIQKYFPDVLPCLAAVVSPMLAHAMDLKKRHKDAKVVFIGPCVSKKDEAYRYGHVDVVLTYEELSSWFEEEKIVLEKEEEDVPHSKARLFPIPGGVLKTMVRDQEEYTYMAIDGVENCISALKDIQSGNLEHCFIEMNTCVGSCIGGPVMEKFHRSPIRDTMAVTRYAGKKDFIVEHYDQEELLKDHEYLDTYEKIPTEKEIQKIFKQMGKTKKEDELNCSSCGYNTCREKAIAIYQGKAEISMCLPNLVKKAESFSDHIINNTPNVIIVLNDNLEIQQMNKAAYRMFKISGNVIMGEHINRLMDPSEFLKVQMNKVSLRDKNIYLADYDKHVAVSIIYDHDYHLLICIMRDITDTEQMKQKRDIISAHTIEVADQVVDKQMRIVQEIASLLGETAAETKIALTKLKESIKDE